jgi:hypothetical protein
MGWRARCSRPSVMGVARSRRGLRAGRPHRGAIALCSFGLQGSTRTLPNLEMTTVWRVDPRESWRDAFETPRVNPWGEKVNCRCAPSRCTPSPLGPSSDQRGTGSLRRLMAMRAGSIASVMTCPRAIAKSRARACAVTMCDAAEWTARVSSRTESAGTATPNRMPVTARTSMSSTSVTPLRMRYDMVPQRPGGTFFVRGAAANGGPG